MPIPTTTKRTKVGQDISSLGNLIFMYDANDLVNAYANGDLVSSLNDLSGNGFTMTGTTTSRPTLVTNADTNGNAAMLFDGGDILSMADSNYLDNLLIEGNNGMTFFEVISSTSNNGIQQVTWAKSTQSATGPLLWTRNVLDVVYPSLFIGDGGSNYLERRGGTGIYNAGVKIITFDSTATTKQSYMDGVSQTMTTMYSSGTGKFAGNATGASIGQAGGGGMPFFGSIYLVGAFMGILNANTRLTLNRILSARFQISIVQ